MISYPLFAWSFRENRRFLFIFTGIISLYTLLIFYAYGHVNPSGLTAVLSSLPPEVLSALGISVIADASLTEFAAVWLFGFFILIFPLIFESVTAVRRISAGIAGGRFVYFLASPVSRKQIAFTLGTVLTGSTGILLSTAGITGNLCAYFWYPGELHMDTYWLLFAGCFALHFFLGSISFFSCCAGRTVRFGGIFGVGIPFLFCFLHMLANMGGRFGAVRYFTVFTLFDADLILTGNSFAFIQIAILGLGGIFFYILGIVCFKRRDLTI